MFSFLFFFFVFFFNDTATTEIYTLSLHDALPISPPAAAQQQGGAGHVPAGVDVQGRDGGGGAGGGRRQPVHADLLWRRHLVRQSRVPLLAPARARQHERARGAGALVRRLLLSSRATARRR